MPKQLRPGNRLNRDKIKELESDDVWAKITTLFSYTKPFHIS